jgi:7-carboxy-7-deazaguanine synthase
MSGMRVARKWLSNVAGKPMTYSVKEMFYTLQGEGTHAGRAAVFLRFSGCNLWSGREQDRSSAICQFCDTDFIGTNGEGGGKFDTPQTLAAAVAALWPDMKFGAPYVVCTGGEPLLQLDTPLIEALHAQGFEIAVETNGTVEAPPGIDWICVSPKAGAAFVQRTGHELKLVYPQPFAMPDMFTSLDFAGFFLQPMDGQDAEKNTAAAVTYCLAHPQWRLSLQTHKMLGIP